MPEAHAEGILNRFEPRGLLHKSVWQSLFSAFGGFSALSVLRKSTAPKGRDSGKRIKFAGTAKGSPFGRAAEQSEAERARLLPVKAIVFLWLQAAIGLLHKEMIAFLAIQCICGANGRTLRRDMLYYTVLVCPGKRGCQRRKDLL